MIVSGEAGGTGKRSVEAEYILRQRAIQERGFRPEQDNGGHGRKRGELPGAAVVGRQQVSHRSGVARQINTARVPTMLHDGASESPVLFQPDDSYRMAIRQQGLA